MAEAPVQEREVTLELPVLGMDCAGCVNTVRGAICSLPGVDSADVFLASETALIRLDPDRVGADEVRRAIESAGYESPREATAGRREELQRASKLGNWSAWLLAAIFAVVLAAVIAGEWLGLFDTLTARIPLWAGALFVLASGFRVFRKVFVNLLHGRIVSHTLMSAGALAALAVGEWVTAVLVVIFMRVGDFAESFTTDQARQSLRELSALLPSSARVERDGVEESIPVAQLRPGDLVVVRPGETIPVDGKVAEGRATVDQSTLTGESLPTEVEPGSRVFASTLARLGSLRVVAEEIGRDTAFGKVIGQVEQAEANRGQTQVMADRFAAWYLPLVAAIALATYLLSGDLLAAVAVTVVACSCAFALAAPVAMLASIGAAAKRGLLIKGGKHLETLARADVLLLDKTGTVTQGRMRLTDIVPVSGWNEEEVLSLAAAAERDSEHPLGEAVREASLRRRLPTRHPTAFEAVPGVGVRAVVDGRTVEVGSRRLLPDGQDPTDIELPGEDWKSRLYVLVDGKLAGVLGAADTVRPDVAAALAHLRRLGIGRIELLTGDNHSVAATVAGELGIDYRADLLPADKLAIVAEYQRSGNTVMMIGDGVNDAPSLAQADVGVAMGAAGSDIAIETAHVALLSEDWSRVPELLEIAKRTMGVVKLNIGFTAAYNVIGISLAAFGLLPPIFAAALQSIPDLGIMGNSARLLRFRADATRAAKSADRRSPVVTS